jgi:hypothetical protein
MGPASLYSAAGMKLCKGFTVRTRFHFRWSEWTWLIALRSQRFTESVSTCFLLACRRPECESRAHLPIG